MGAEDVAAEVVEANNKKGKRKEAGEFWKIEEILDQDGFHLVTLSTISKTAFIVGHVGFLKELLFAITRTGR